VRILRDGLVDGHHPSKAQDDDEHRGVSVHDVEHVDDGRHHDDLGAHGHDIPPCGGVPDVFGGRNDDDSVAGIGLRQRPCGGVPAGEPGSLQRRDRLLDDRGADGRLDL
jgi:hypothetical protein